MRVVTSRYSVPDDHPIPSPDDIMVGYRDHWRVIEVTPIDSRIWVNTMRIRQQQLGPHHGRFAHLDHGDPVTAGANERMWTVVPLGSDRPPELLR